MANETSAGSFFEGDERLEPFPALGRLIRKGSPAALKVSDAERVRQALRAGDAERARGYLSIVRPSAEMMVTSYVEFILAFAPVLAAPAGAPGGHAPVYARAYELWKVAADGSAELGGGGADPDVARAQRLFRPEAIGPETVGEFRQALMAGGRTLAADLIEGPTADFDRLAAALAAGDFAAAEGAFEDYYRRMRLAHDLLVELDSLLISSIRELCGQKAAEEILYRAFTGCIFYQGLWQLVGGMSAVEVAAFLADHLRGHFSGPGREGVTDVVEEAGRVRLVFAPCGSGGAMRMRGANGAAGAAAPFTEASAQTWSRRGEVPGYCSHCAVNELESVRRLGYPLMVTEFDPDPGKPCGWTVYKDPSFIPEAAFRRIGAARDPSRFPGAKRGG